MSLFCILIALNIAFIACTPAAQTQTSFSTKLLQALVEDRSTENIIFSPVSIKSCLALAYLGAGGSTAEELKSALELSGDSSSSSKETAAVNFKAILHKHSTQNEEGIKVKIANRIYVGKQFELATKFNEIATKHFEAAAENVDFAQGAKTSKQINAWIEEQTENKIKNLIAPDDLNADTAAVLINAIYFKANWTSPFESYATQRQNFALSETQHIEVDMMSQQEKFLYGDLEDLQATAIEMSYEGSDLAMLVLLPKAINGLAALEAKLNKIDLLKLSGAFKWEKVNLKLPKFKLEFDISLQPVLEKLGIKAMFTPQADFTELLQSKQHFSVSEVKHKAFIEVNEVGTEAAAATFVKIGLESLIINERIFDFTADHPFFFAIKDTRNIYFAGHVAKF